MKRLIVDMDDVIADATGQFIQYYEKEFGVRVARESLNHQDEGQGFPGNHDIVNQFPFRESFFQTMTPMLDSQEILAELNKKYELFIVSAAMQFPQSLSEKFKWLAEHFPFLHWRQIVFCGSKDIVHGHYMIDDLAYNLENFSGEKFIFTAPHNLQIDKYPRLNSWKHAGEKFL